jgi:hypothetical protein
MMVVARAVCHAKAIELFLTGADRQVHWQSKPTTATSPTKKENEAKQTKGILSVIRRKNAACASA